MTKIELKPASNGDQKVYLEGKHIGTIARVKGGWQYGAKGSRKVYRGDVFPSLAACIRSVRGDDLCT